MTTSPRISFSTISTPGEGTIILLAGEEMKLGPTGQSLDEASGGALSAAARAARFTGKAAATLELIAPRGLEFDRIVLVGLGKIEEAKPFDWLKAGGAAMGKLDRGVDKALALIEAPQGEVGAELAAEFAAGMVMRAYRFDRYKTKKKKDEEETGTPAEISVAVADPDAARKAFERLSAVAEGVVMARDLVNEPANVLGPVEFAERCEPLRELGVEVEILGEPELAELGMRAFLGVAQGSERPARMVVMRWNGGKDGDDPVCFLGKGVVFDTGGISIKGSSGMEDMKGDMAGAACVVGLMHALAKREARVNAVGLIGLVENMPDGKAQRPGDIVTSMSGQTIEIINTDAEGRLVLGDVTTYCQRKFKPRFMIDLATLTGAVIITLGHERAGLFSNNDELSDRLIAAGEATGDRLWRLPIAPEYDKLIDSKVADMKNSGGRQASSTTAAQFIHRFVENELPWAHLDIAGTAMGSPQTEVNRSWGSGFGVRLLDRLVADHYEA